MFYGKWCGTLPSCGWPIKQWERINHDEDQTGDCLAPDRGADGCALCCPSQEAQACQAAFSDRAIRSFRDGRNVDDATRNLWDIRNSCWISGGSFSGVVQLALGRLDACSPHLEQHQSSGSQVKVGLLTYRLLNQFNPPSSSSGWPQ